MGERKGRGGGVRYSVKVKTYKKKSAMNLIVIF